MYQYTKAELEEEIADTKLQLEYMLNPKDNSFNDIQLCRRLLKFYETELEKINA